MKIGAHLSVSGGYHKALERAKEIGANCLQIFSGSPRFWQRPKVTQEEIEFFKTKAKELQISPIYFHAPYLINLVGTAKTKELSVRTLKWELNIAEKLGVKGTVVHLGSFKNSLENINTLSETIKEILEESPPNTLFIMENSGTRKIGKDLEELARILEKVSSPRLKICLDTCHLFSAGYDFTTAEALEELLEKIEKLFGLENLELFHANDSKDPFESLRDRHENIGEGYIGKEAFALLLNHPKLQKLPFIIETPGFDQKGPDKKNLDILKSLISK